MQKDNISFWTKKTKSEQRLSSLGVPHVYLVSDTTLPNISCHLVLQQTYEISKSWAKLQKKKQSQGDYTVGKIT